MSFFENLHPTKGRAFLDGLLCGVVISIIVVKTIQARKEERELFPK